MFVSVPDNPTVVD